MKAEKLKKDKSPFRYLQWTLALLLTAVLLIIIFFFSNENYIFNTQEDTILYFVGNKLEYGADAKIYKKGDQTIIEEEGQSIALDSTPLSYKGERKIFLPSTMSYVNPNNTNQDFKINFFSIVYEKDKSIFIKDKKKEKASNGGFLFDGNDTYVFLEDMTIIVGNLEYEVPSMSYANVIYQGYMELYNIDTNEYEWIALANIDVMARSSTGYEINLGTDVLKKGSSEQILFTGIDTLNVWE